MDALQMLLDGPNTNELAPTELQEALAIDQDALDVIPEVYRGEEDDITENFEENDDMYF
jgi:hypothetical protein